MITMRLPFATAIFVLLIACAGNGSGTSVHAAPSPWQPTSLTGAPSTRGAFSTVWTGSEMIVWGGDGGNGPVSTGARYNATMDTWTRISTLNAPSPRRFHTAVWTGSEMFVWGGESGNGGVDLNTGGLYNPSTDTWTPISTTNAPPGTYALSCVWTGSKVIVWGGRSSSLGVTVANTGGIYDPATDTWASTSVVNAPSARMQYTSVWTGSEMIVWGGSRDNNTATAGLTTGGRYNPSTDTWTSTSDINAPVGGANHSSVWTGTEMIVWGGNLVDSSYTNTGGRYSPVTDTWQPTSTVNAPTPRCFQLAVWTGTEMLIWGGNTGAIADVNSEWLQLNTGGRYNPTSDTWIGISFMDAPIPRSGANGGNEMRAIWTGTAMVVWGGDIGRFFLGAFYQTGTGGRYTLANDSDHPATVPFPSIAGLNIPGGSPDGGTQVIITGAHFTPDSTVILTPNAHNYGGGVSATIMSVAADGTALTISTPPGSGKVDVVVITDGGLAIAPGAYTYGSVASPLTITNGSPLPTGTIGVAYSVTLAASGGTTPYTWAIDSGTLPPGLALDTVSGTISGTPTSAGSFAFTVRVTDHSATPLTITQQFTLAPPPPSGTGGTVYQSSVTITPPSGSGGGSATCSNYTLAMGTLPAGLTLNASTGTISGTPTNGGTYTFTVQCVVSGGVAQTASQQFTITINNPAPVLTSISPSSTVAGGSAFTLTLTGTGFVSGSTAQWNGANRPTTYVSPTQLTAAISAADITTAGNASVTVVNSAPGGGTAAAKTLTITATPTPPTQTGPILFTDLAVAYPNGGAAVAPGGAVTVSIHITDSAGSIVGSPTLRYAKPDGTDGPFTQFTRTGGTASDGTYTATVSIDQYYPTGTYLVKALYAYDGAGHTATLAAPNAAVAPLALTVGSGGGGGGSGAPVFTAITVAPSTVAPGGTAVVTVTVTGSVSGGSITYLKPDGSDGPVGSFTKTGDTTYTANILIDQYQSAGVYRVKSLMAYGGSGQTVITPGTAPLTPATTAGAITVGIPAPVIASISPTSGPVSGGTLVTITGTGFRQGAKVTFGGVQGPDPEVFDGGTRLTVLTPAVTTGSVAVVVTNPDGQTSSGSIQANAARANAVTKGVAFTYVSAAPGTSGHPTMPISGGSGTVVPTTPPAKQPTAHPVSPVGGGNGTGRGATATPTPVAQPARR